MEIKTTEQIKDIKYKRVKGEFFYGKEWVSFDDYYEMKKTLQSSLDFQIRYSNKLEKKLHPKKKGEPTLKTTNTKRGRKWEL